MEAGDIATWLSAGIAAASAVMAFLSSRKAEKSQQQAAEFSQKNSELLEKQHNLELRAWTDQYFSSVRDWADAVCIAISEAAHIANIPDSDRKLNIKIRLGSLIDTGRWYFPNTWTENFGVRKEPAYRGLRQPVLDCVVDAYRLIEKPNASYEQFTAVQRQFVSHIQEALDPRKREEEINKILRDFEESERLRSKA